MEPSDCQVELRTSSVVYRTIAGHGQRIVIVFLGGTTPRILSYVEDFQGQTPSPLWLDEVLSFVKDAQNRATW